MERIGHHTGHFNVEASHFAELVRISGVGYKATENVIIRRKKLHAQKRVMIMSITRIMGQGCINYTFCTKYFRLYIFILSCAFYQKINPVNRFFCEVIV